MLKDNNEYIFSWIFFFNAEVRGFSVVSQIETMGVASCAISPRNKNFTWV